MKTKNNLLLILILIIALSACKPKDESEDPLNAPTKNLSEVSQETNPENEPSVLDTVVSYPINDADNTYPVSVEQNTYPISYMLKQGPKFTIDEPVVVDAEFVTGTGPANVPIRLVDVSLMGKEIGKTTIGQDGAFRFELDNTLVPGHSIGLMIGDLSKTDFNYDDFMYSNEYYDKPMIGTIFYIAVVTN